ncbi:MAG: FecR family protein [Mucilaginibacter sp.]|nr:FecR family protein [Mucilaginibacter sp.]
MEKRKFLILLKKYRTGQASEQEKAYLTAYYNLFDARPDVTEMLNPEETDFLKNQIKTELKNKIDLHQQKPAAKTFKLYYRLTAAAVVLIAFSAGLLFYAQKDNDNIFSAFRHKPNDIAPGGNKAILTLANGKQIILTNAKNGLLAQQGGTQINKTANGQIIYNVAQTVKGTDTAFNTITTPRGGQYMVVLPDSSRVYLDANSSLRFPAAFSGKLRTVMLTGEAYFEVAHNKNMPFHVISKGQTVEVLGTHFNINAYNDEKDIKTTLLEGSVRVSAEGGTALLKPGEQSQIAKTVTAGKNITVIQNANTDEAVAWKNGFFQFENADIQTIMRQFARWYNVDVVFEGNVQERLFSGEIHRNLTVLQALDLLNYANVHFNIDGKKIIVSP